MCGLGEDAGALFDTNVPIAFSCRGIENVLLLTLHDQKKYFLNVQLLKFYMLLPLLLPLLAYCYARVAYQQYYYYYYYFTSWWQVRVVISCTYDKIC